MLQHADMCQSLTVPEVTLFILLPKLFVQILQVDFFLCRRRDKERHCQSNAEPVERSEDIVYGKMQKSCRCFKFLHNGQKRMSRKTSCLFSVMETLTIRMKPARHFPELT